MSRRVLKYVGLSLVLMGLNLHAENQLDSKTITEENLDSVSGYDSSDSNTTDVTREFKREQQFVDEVVLNHVMQNLNEKSNEGSFTGNSAGLAYNNIAAYMALQKSGSSSSTSSSGSGGNNSSRTEIAEKPKLILTGGYCRLLAPLEVNTLAQYASFSCDLEGSQDKVRLTALIEPEHISKALIARPMYIKTAKGKRFRIKDGVVMNAKQTSINVASVVNDYALSRLIAQGTIDGSKIVSQYAKSYLDAKQRSDITQNMYYGENNNTLGGLVYGTRPTVTTNVRPPKRRDYVNMAGIELASKMIELLGEAFIDKLDYLYKMEANTLYYVDMAVSTDEGMVGVDYRLDDLVHKSPRTSRDARGSAGGSSRSPVSTQDIDHIHKQDIDVKKVMQEMRSSNQSSNTKTEESKPKNGSTEKKYRLD